MRFHSKAKRRERFQTNDFPGKNQGYGVVKFSSWKDADDAMRQVQWIGDSRVKCTWDDEE